MVFFSSGKGGGDVVDYGYKGKGVTTHLLVDGHGNPIAFEVTSAKGDERKQVEPLLNQVSEFVGLPKQISGPIPTFEADKGYDSEELRIKILERRIFPLIPYRKMGKSSAEKKIASWVKRKRWQVERAISWLQRKFRRIVGKWERRLKYWKGFLNFAMIKFWLDRLSG